MVSRLAWTSVSVAAGDVVVIVFSLSVGTTILQRGMPRCKR
ncbi:protein of unknown function [Modestobacter italicus]|uniref:Uncharacterized protein n=1 Tax=Modestobacter italicus (strain DSM 44449 / CECT 9708 / BC 501) TaxID=2732864 RepID=I4ESI7_MODI5|nr:protein of unknown function [Modestobacter marinus]